MSFSSVINNLIQANVVAFLVMVAIIWYACVKLKAGAFFEKKRQEIKAVVDKSEQTKQAALSELNNIKQEMNVLPEKIAALKDEAKNTADILSENIAKDTQSKIKILNDNVQTALDYQVKNVKSVLSQDISSAAVDIAKEKFEKILQENPDIHYGILSECIEKL